MAQTNKRTKSDSSYSEEFEEPIAFFDSLPDDFLSFGTSAQNLEMNPVSVVPDDTFTITQAVNAFGFGKFQAKLSLFTGLCWMADSMEMTILSILGPALHCEWNISRYQQALVTTVVFLGMMLSSTFWSFISDKICLGFIYNCRVFFGNTLKYKYKTSLHFLISKHCLVFILLALLLCAYLLLYYGALSSFAPNYIWILILRGVVGFAIGCVPQSVTLYAEFLPSKQRAKCVVLLDCFWALGACFEVVLALLIMPTLGWSWLLFLSTAPALAFTFISPLLPESARYNVQAGQPEKALETLRNIANENNKPMLLGRLVVDDSHIEAQGRIKDLLIPPLWKTSALLWVVWTVCAFCYYGVVLMTTGLIEASTGSCFKSNADNYPSCSAECKNLNTQDYMDLLWTTFAEFPGIFASIFVIERFGRKKTMAIQFIVFAVSLSLLYFCFQNHVILTMTLFLARGIIAGVFQAAYVYTPELYPPGLRTIGVGTCSAMARFGAMLTPYISQVLLQYSMAYAITVYTVVSLLAAFACSCLPIEPKHLQTKETPNQ